MIADTAALQAARKAETGVWLSQLESGRLERAPPPGLPHGLFGPWASDGLTDDHLAGVLEHQNSCLHTGASAVRQQHTMHCPPAHVAQDCQTSRDTRRASSVCQYFWLPTSYLTV